MRSPALGMRVVSVALSVLGIVNQVHAAVTIYYAPGQTPLSQSNGTATGTSATATPTFNDQALQAYSTATLVAPAPPGADAMPTAFPLAVPNAVPSGASMPQNGDFFGFSIEMSVVNQVLGRNSTLLQVPFLNLMANIQQRVGRINIRVGGNSQETATLVASTSDGRILEKDKSGASNPTNTPPLVFTNDLIYMMRNISNLVNVHWYLGVPFNDTNFRLGIVEQGKAILGDYLIGIQAGNEPDLYAKPTHGKRPPDYDQTDYFGEIGELIKALDADTAVASANNLLIAPSVSTGWTPESVWDTGFISAYTSSLQALSVERYPFDNCGVAFPNSGIQVQDPQALFPQYLAHSAATGQVGPYLNSVGIAQAAGKPFLMFETNTASCGGFPGLSDSFGAALWGVDYAMQMAAVNFTGALFHVAGQSVSYNPFTPPPTNESHFHQWTVGPIYYSALMVAEALGATNTSQVVDLQANSNNDFSPAYGIWEHGSLARVLLINFSNDPSGGSDLQVDLTMPGGTLPAQVDVKLLLASNVTQKGNFTWAGQTFGGNFASDGRLIGSDNTAPTVCGVPADGSSQAPVCRIRVPAPGAALVFMTGSAASNDVAGAPSVTFATTSTTKARASLTASVDPAMLATSNGHSGSTRPLGATSKKSFQQKGEAPRLRAPEGSWTALGVIFAGIVYLVV